MNRKRRTLLLLFLPLAVLMAVSAAVIYRDYRQQGLNQDLIASLKRGDVATEVRLLNAGADTNARDRGYERASFGEMLRGYWQRLQHGKPLQEKSHRTAGMVAVHEYIRLKTNNPSHGPAPDDVIPIAMLLPLLEQGADVNQQDEDGYTLLNYACSARWSRMACLLIDRGANVNTGKAEGWTPLMLAVVNGDTEVIKRLLKAGADVNAKAEMNTSALFIAKANDKSKIVRLLQQAGAHE